MRLGAVYAVGLGALAFATPAYAADDPPPPAVRAPLVEHAFELPGEVQLSVVAALKATNSPIDQETPANMPPPASATTQADTVGQSRSQAISPKHAQKSPERASTNESQHLAVSAPSDEPQYHPRHVQYQQPSNVRAAMRRLVLPTTGFSAREPKGITPPSSPIELPNLAAEWCVELLLRSRRQLGLRTSRQTVVRRCSARLIHCRARRRATTHRTPSTAIDTGAQYQPDDTQYQTPAETTCDAPDDPVVPIAEPVEPVPTSPGDADTTAATAGVPPTTEPAGCSGRAGHRADAVWSGRSSSGRSARGSSEKSHREPLHRQAQSSSVVQSEAAVARRARDLGTGLIGDAERPGPAQSPTGTKHGGEELDLQPQARGHGVAARPPRSQPRCARVSSEAGSWRVSLFHSSSLSACFSARSRSRRGGRFEREWGATACPTVVSVGADVAESAIASSRRET